MVDLVQDASKVSFFFAGLSAFTLLSYLGRAFSHLSGGVLVLFIALHLVALLFALICIGVAIGKRDAEMGTEGMLATILCACIPAAGVLVTIWTGCGLGAWIGG